MWGQRKDAGRLFFARIFHEAKRAGFGGVLEQVVGFGQMPFEFHQRTLEFFGGGNALEGAIHGFLQLQNLVDGTGQPGDAVELLDDAFLGLRQLRGRFFLSLGEGGGGFGLGFGQRFGGGGDGLGGGTGKVGGGGGGGIVTDAGEKMGFDVARGVGGQLEAGDGFEENKDAEEAAGGQKGGGGSDGVEEGDKARGFGGKQGKGTIHLGGSHGGDLRAGGAGAPCGKQAANVAYERGLALQGGQTFGGDGAIGQGAFIGQWIAGEGHGLPNGIGERQKEIGTGKAEDKERDPVVAARRFCARNEESDKSAEHEAQNQNPQQVGEKSITAFCFFCFHGHRLSRQIFFGVCGFPAGMSKPDTL